MTGCGIVTDVSLIEEPVPGAQQALLRRVVIEHKRAERRRRFPPVLHVGWPGRPEVGRVGEPAWRRSGNEEELDHGLRCDLLSALLRRAPDGDLIAWLSRPGGLDLQDVDAAWLRAVSAVAAETGRVLPFVVVTQRGWRDPRSGVGREWRRLRQR